MKPNRDHKTVRVSLGTVEVDARLAPLIPLLWKRGIETCPCSQEWRSGQAAIAFLTLIDAMEFLNVAGRKYTVEVEAWDEGEDGEHFFVCDLLVFFPIKEVPELVKRFKAALASD